MRTAITLSLVIGVGVLSAASAANAQGQPSGNALLGENGHVAISAERMFGYAHSSVEQTPARGVAVTNNADTFSILSPSATAANVYNFPRLAGDLFIAENFSVGLAVGYAHVATSQPALADVTTNSYLVAPRVGYALHIGNIAALWPRGGFTYLHQSQSGGIIGNNNDVSLSAYALTVEIPVAFTLAPHTFLLIGPNVEIGLGGTRTVLGASVDAKATDLGVQVGFAGQI